MNSEIKMMMAKEFDKLDDACFSRERRYHTMQGFIDALCAMKMLTHLEDCIFRTALVAWYDDDINPDWENIRTEL